MMSAMKLPVIQLLPLFLLAACTFQPQPEPVKEVFMESPCVKVLWRGTPFTVEGVTLSYGPEEWSERKPGGIYKGDGDACRGELLVMPYTLRGEKGTEAELYSVLRVEQPWFVGFARAELTAPLHYNRGLLSLTPDRDSTEGLRQYGVLKMGERNPLALVDAEGEPYTRCELKPVAQPHGTDYPGGYFQHRRKGAGEWDGLLLLKQDFGGDGDTAFWFNIARVEQSAPGAMPVVTVLHGLQRRGNVLVDSSGHVHYTIHHGALHDHTGRKFPEMQLIPVIPVVRSGNAP